MYPLPCNSHQLLTQYIQRLTQDQKYFHTAVPHLKLYRADNPSKPNASLHVASLCMIVQGEKEVILGKKKYIYNAQNFLFATFDLPVIAHIRTASPNKPYLTIILELDPNFISQFIIEANIPPTPIKKPMQSITLGKVTEALSNCFLRLLTLKENEVTFPILSSLILKEIYCYLLMSPQGEQLRYITAPCTKWHQIHTVIQSFKNRFAEPLNMDEIAFQTGMSPSSFYQHFKNITSMSPLQYLKRLRLTEARRLLINQKEDITSISLQVGYESTSQFSREYKRLFGTTPSLDIKQFLR